MQPEDRPPAGEDMRGPGPDMVRQSKPVPHPARIAQHIRSIERFEWSRVIVFTDVDDTLLQTEGKLPEDQTAVTGALDRSGQPLSYITRKQRTLLGLLEAAAACIIPVTGRNRAALERVCYRFRGYRAVSHGAVILTAAGRLCPRWQAVLSNQSQDWTDIMVRTHKTLADGISHQGLDARVTMIIDEGVHAYISVKGTEAALDDLLHPVQDALAELGLRLHRNGRNAAILPPYACKRRAVEHIAEQLEITADDLVLGLGDSLSDLPFLRTADFMLVPVASQIDRTLES